MACPFPGPVDGSQRRARKAKEANDAEEAKRRVARRARRGQPRQPCGAAGRGRRRRDAWHRVALAHARRHPERRGDRGGAPGMSNQGLSVGPRHAALCFRRSNEALVRNETVAIAGFGRCNTRNAFRNALVTVRRRTRGTPFPSGLDRRLSHTLQSRNHGAFVVRTCSHEHADPPFVRRSARCQPLEPDWLIRLLTATDSSQHTTTRHCPRDVLRGLPIRFRQREFPRISATIACPSKYSRARPSCPSGGKK